MTLRETPAGRALLGSVLGLAVAVVAGMVILWPSGDGPPLTGQRFPQHSEGAEVERVIKGPCAGLPQSTCRKVEIRIKSGADEGKRTSFELQATPPLDPDIEAGDDIRVTKQGSFASGGELSYRLAGKNRNRNARGPARHEPYASHRDARARRARATDGH